MQLLLILILLLLACTAVSVSSAASVTGCSGCFVVPVATHVKVVSSIVYAQRPGDPYMSTLLLDAYALQPSPPSISTAALQMPAVIVVHGGACITGSRSEGFSVAVANAFALRGYAAFSVDYRLTGSCVTGAALAAADVQAAVRFVKVNAHNFSVDVTRIVLVGSSAGAIAALQAALIPAPGADKDIVNNATLAALINWGAVSSDVSAVISLSGAVINYGDLPLNPTADNLPPLYLFHGTQDPIVPVDASILLYARALSFNQTAILRLAPAGHVPVPLISSSYLQDMAWFLKIQLGLNDVGTGTCLFSPTCVGVGANDSTTGWSTSLSISAGRTYQYYIPSNYASRTGPLPVMIGLHSEGSDGDVFMWATNLQAAADANNYILIKAEGTYFAQTGQVWNGGSCCAPATTNAVDDVTYVRNIIGDLAFRGIDFDGLRVSAIGHSNGGMMALRLGCVASDQIAGVGSNAAALGNVNASKCAKACPGNVTTIECFDTTKCPPGISLPSYFTCASVSSGSRLAPMTMLFGLLDQSTRYTGGQGISGSFSLPVPYFESTVASQYDGTVGTAPTPNVPYISGVVVANYSSQGGQDTAACVSCSDCLANITVCVAAEGGHTWPAGQLESQACYDNISSLICMSNEAQSGLITHAYNATTYFFSSLATHSLNDFTTYYLDTFYYVTTASSSATLSPGSTVALSDSVYVCTFNPTTNCAMNTGNCQQVTVNKCQPYSGLPPQTGLKTIYVIVNESTQAYFDASLFPNPDCTGTILGNELKLQPSQFGVCSKLDVGFLGNILDYAFFSSCSKCLPSKSSAMTTASSSGRFGSTATSSVSIGSTATSSVSIGSTATSSGSSGSTATSSGSIGSTATSSVSIGSTATSSGSIGSTATSTATKITAASPGDNVSNFKGSRIKLSTWLAIGGGIVSGVIVTGIVVVVFVYKRRRAKRMYHVSFGIPMYATAPMSEDELQSDSGDNHDTSVLL